MKHHKGASALALGLALMLTQTEAAALKIRGLDPQLKQAIARLADNRPVILARAPWANYNSVVGGVATVMSYTFAGFDLVPGDMIRVQLVGTGINSSGANAIVAFQAQAVQGAAVVQLGGGVAGVPTNAALYGWKADLLFSVNLPGVQGNYVPNINARAVTTGGTYSSGNQTLTGIGFTGGGVVLVTDVTGTGPQLAGGKLLNSAGGVTGSGMSSRITPFTLDPSQPIEIDILVSDVSTAAKSITVNAGVMEGL